ncbi:hypothetical protein D3C72_1767800 [compost metagenome]
MLQHSVAVGRESVWIQAQRHARVVLGHQLVDAMAHQQHFVFHLEPAPCRRMVIFELAHADHHPGMHAPVAVDLRMRLAQLFAQRPHLLQQLQVVLHAALDPRRFFQCLVRRGDGVLPRIRVRSEFRVPRLR